MSRLTSKERPGLAPEAFALPARRAYPIPNASHARAALSMVAAHGTAAERKKVRNAVANRFPEIKQGKSR